jgi:cellulose synthase/poly-beta-1,6-N-acetylglucosamine synthase-like glycosyltransferase
MKNIARYLPGVLVQKYPSTHEVIVVNDNSCRRFKYILEELQKTFKLLQIVDLKQEAKLISGKKYPLSYWYQGGKT